MFPFKLRTYKDTAYKHCHGNSNQCNATRKEVRGMNTRKAETNKPFWSITCVKENTNRVTRKMYESNKRVQ